MDLENIVTPVDPDQFEELLIETNFDAEKRSKIIQGFREGFSLEYVGRRDIVQEAPNLKFTEAGDHIDLWNKVMKEVKLNCYAGPFEHPPFTHYIQSPIGLVPKDGGKDTRLIFHLSHPRSGKVKTSINANIPADLYTVKYPEFDQAVQLCLKVGKNCKLGHSDIRSAFRILGIQPQDWPLLVMKARSPIDGKMYYFVDKCLPFGASISCALFQLVSDAIAHIVKCKSEQELVNYLDDFLFVALMKWWCNRQLDIFLEVCSQIGFPVNEDKTFRATGQITFLGMLFNAKDQTVSVPVEKIEKALKLISNVLSKTSKKITVHDLQKICSFLNFLGRCMLPGRVFTRHLYVHLGGSLNQT